MTNSAEGSIDMVLSALTQGVRHIQYPVKMHIKICRVIEDLPTQGILGISGKYKQLGWLI